MLSKCLASLIHKSMKDHGQGVQLTFRLGLFLQCPSVCLQWGSCLPWAQLSFSLGAKNSISARISVLQHSPKLTHSVRDPPMKARSSSNTFLEGKILWMPLPMKKYYSQRGHSSQTFQDKHHGLHLFTKEDKSGLCR